LKPLGEKYGYEHIWLTADQPVKEKTGYLSILNNKRFYTIHFATDTALNLKMLLLGANDPDMSLVESKAFMLSSIKSGNQTFFNVIETHGRTNSVSETTTGAASKVSDLKVLNSSKDRVTVSFKIKTRLYTCQINYQNKENFIKIN
jgi:oligo-alginate lyase